MKVFIPRSWLWSCSEIEVTQELFCDSRNRSQCKETCKFHQQHRQVGSALCKLTPLTDGNILYRNDWAKITFVLCLVGSLNSCLNDALLTQQNHWWVMLNGWLNDRCHKIVKRHSSGPGRQHDCLVWVVDAKVCIWHKTWPKNGMFFFQAVTLTWYPLIRDSSFYLLSIICLILVRRAWNEMETCSSFCRKTERLNWKLLKMETDVPCIGHKIRGQDCSVGCYQRTYRAKLLLSHSPYLMVVSNGTKLW